MAGDITLEDLVFIYKNKLACRHLSSGAAFYKHRTSEVIGDSYAIGAIHTLIYPENIRTSDMALREAMMAQTINGEVAIRAGGAQLVERFKEEIRKMVEQSVVYDIMNTVATDCRFLVYEGVDGARIPYDKDVYPFGKCGQAKLHPDNCCVTTFIGASERDALAGSDDAIINYLTEKLLGRLHDYCERSRAQQAGQRQASSSSPPM